MEEIQVENYAITFEHFEGEIENIEAAKLYYSTLLLNERGQLDERIINRSRIKVSSKNIEQATTRTIYFIGVLSASNKEYLPIKYVIQGNVLIIGFETIVMQVDPQTLNLKWVFNDFTDIISVEIFKGDIFVYDELSVARIDHNGNMKWKFTGSDHFVSYIGTENFKFFENCIEMVDSNEVVYRISYEGDDLDNINKNYFKSF